MSQKQREKVLRELGLWDILMRFSAIGCEIRMAQTTLTRAEWNKVGKALEELVFEMRGGNLADIPGGSHYKSAMWLLGGKK